MLKTQCIIKEDPTYMDKVFIIMLFVVILIICLIPGVDFYTDSYQCLNIHPYLHDVMSVQVRSQLDSKSLLATKT